MDITSTINDAARLNRGILPTDPWSAEVIPQYVLTGSVVRSEVRGVGSTPGKEPLTMRNSMYFEPAIGVGAIPTPTTNAQWNALYSQIAEYKISSDDYDALLSAMPASQRTNIEQSFGTAAQYRQNRVEFGMAEPVKAGLSIGVLAAAGIAAWYFFMRKR